MPIVIAAICAFVVTYVFCDLNVLYALRENQNTGLYLQTLVDLVHHGSAFNWGDQRPFLLKPHDEWIVLVLLPFINVWPRAETLLIAQVLLLGLAAVPLYLFVRACGGSTATAVCVALAYLVSPSVQGFAYRAFVPTHFVPVLAFLLAYFVRKRSLAGTLVCAQLLMGTKEDVLLFLAWLAAFGAVFYDRRLGIAVLVLAAVNGVAYYGYETWHGVAPTRPSYGLLDPQWPQQLAFLAETLAPFAFAPLLLRWRLLLAVPLLIELFLPQHYVPFVIYSAGSYYTESLVALIAIGAGIALASRPRWARIALVCAFVMAIFLNTTVLHFGRHPFSRDPQYGIARAWALRDERVDFPCRDEGAWVVAAPNVQARIVGCGKPGPAGRPAWHDEPLDSHAAWTQLPVHTER
ncbi:MAG: DUF2079 domain-containing protein [Candidatus Eremiobacteraeota bacterium]|nr:DUF2079 domain-containing protein [Candidatus Eremiobacteraeota bacterium]